MSAPRSSGVAGVVLAAGLSRRYDPSRSKLVAEIGGRPLVRWVVKAALGSRLSRVVVVLGHAADEVRGVLAGLDVEWAGNAAYAQGQSTSVRAGLAHVAAWPDPDAAGAILFLPGDQPFVTSRLIDRLIAAWESSGQSIVRPRAGGRPGSPVLWDRSLFAELARLRGDAGGRQLLPRHSGEVLEIEVADPRVLADIDTFEDLKTLEPAIRS